MFSKAGMMLGVMWWGSSDVIALRRILLHSARSLGCLFFDSLVGSEASSNPKMASEPAEEAIANFVSFTSTTRDQAISFLKVRPTPRHRFLAQRSKLMIPVRGRPTTSTLKRLSMPTLKIRQAP